MKKLGTTIAVTAIVLGFSTPSFAGNGQDVQFKYNPSAPAATTYMKLSKQAKKACKAELGPLVYLAGTECVEDYMSEVVAKINQTGLTAFHKSEQSDAVKVIKLSELEKDISAQK